MTIGNALSFIKRGIYDGELRKSLNAAKSTDEVNNILASEKLLFSFTDFDEAFHHSLTLCQEQEEADQLKEFKMWWELLLQFLDPSACGNQCSGCC